MNPDYKRHAYARSIFAELRRHLVDRFTPADGNPKGTLICEEVFFSERFVPPEAVQEMVMRLQRLEEQERLQMADFVTTRRALEQPTSKEEVPSEPKEPEKRKRKAADAKGEPVS